MFNTPIGITVMQNGSVVVADYRNNRIRLVAPDGTVTTLAGSGTGGFADGPATTAQFWLPVDAAVMQNGSIVVTDFYNQRIRLIDGIASTLCTVAAHCNNHALSVSGTLSTGCKCTCSVGYTGAACSSCATSYAGYPSCTLSPCGRNVTLLSQPPALSLISLSLSQGDSVVTMVLSAKSINSVVVVYQKGVAQGVSSGFLSGISENDFNSYATCATMPTGISVAADGTGTVAYSHAVNYTLCEQTATDDYLVISCAFEVEHYVWLATDLVFVMTATGAPVVVRAPRSSFTSRTTRRPSALTRTSHHCFL